MTEKNNSGYATQPAMAHPVSMDLDKAKLPVFTPNGTQVNWHLHLGSHHSPREEKIEIRFAPAPTAPILGPPPVVYPPGVTSPPSAPVVVRPMPPVEQPSQYVTRYRYNQTNPGLGVSAMQEVARNQSGTAAILLGGSAGCYENSINRTSCYVTLNAEAGYKLPHDLNGYVGVQAGRATGNELGFNGTSATSQVYARLEKALSGETVSAVFAQIGYTPKGPDTGSRPAVTSLSVGARFK